MILQHPLMQNSKLMSTVFVVLAIGAGIVAAGAGFFLDDPLLIVLGLGGGVAMLFMTYRIEYGLLVLIAITYTRLSDVLVAYHGAPSVAKLFVPALLGIVLLRWVVVNDIPSPWVKTVVVLGIYGMVGFAGLLYAKSSGDVIDNLENYIKDALIAVVIVMILREGVTLRRSVWALILGALFLSTLTTYQQFTGTFDNNYWGFARPEVRQIVSGSSDVRLAGPVSTNYYALILVMVIPLILDRLWHEKGLWPRLVAGAALFTATMSIIFTYSRGGFLSLVVVVAIMIWYKKIKPSTILTVGVALLFLVPLVPDQYKDRLSSLTDLVGAFTESEDAVVEDSSLRGRQSEITAAWQMFGDHPFIGVGQANYNANYLDYAENLGLDLRGVERSAHSLYLEVAAETGILGIITFGLIIFTSFRHLYLAYKQFHKNGQVDYAHITFALGVALVGYLTGSLFLHLAYQRYFWMLIGLTFATKYVAEHEQQRIRDLKPSVVLDN